MFVWEVNKRKIKMKNIIVVYNSIEQYGTFMKYFKE